MYDRDKKGPSALKRITSNIASNKKAADQSAADRMMTYLNVPRAATLVYPAFKQDSIQQSQHHPLHGGVPTPSHYEPPPDTTTTQSMQLVKIEKDVETGHAKVSVLPLKQEQHHVPGNMDENHSSPDYHGHGHGDYNGYADGRQTCRETLLPGERDGESGGSPGSRPCNQKLIRYSNIFTSQASTIKWQHMT